MILKKLPIVLFSLTCFLLLACEASAMADEHVSIKGNDVNMRSGAGTKYKILWKLGSGFPLKVLKRSGDWIRVSDFEGSIGWVHKGIVTSTPHMIVKVNKKSKKKINVRSGPGTNNRIVAKAYYGVVFKTLLQEKGWVKVEHEKGVTGWIRRDLLWGY